MLSCIEASPQPVFCPLFLGGTMKEDGFLLGCCPKCSTRSREAGVVEEEETLGRGQDRKTNTKTKRGEMQKTGEKNKEIRDGERR